MLARFETLKLIRSRRPLIAVAALLLFLALMLIGFYTYAQNETGGQAAFRYTFENRSYFNGLTFGIYAFYFGVMLLLPIFTAMEAGAQIAGETSSRTIWLLLTRPLSRRRIFLVKVGVALALVLLLSAVLLGTSLTVGLLIVGWGDLNLYPGVLQMTDRPQHLDQFTALGRFALAWPAASLGMVAPLGLGLLVSAWSRSAVNAVGTAVALYLVLYAISQVHFFRELRPLLFTSYMGYWRGLFRETIDWPALLRDGARLLAFGCLFLALAYRRFANREET